MADDERIWKGDFYCLADGRVGTVRSVCADPGTDVETDHGVFSHAVTTEAINRFADNMRRAGYTPALLADAMFPGLRGVDAARARENAEVIALNQTYEAS